MLALFAFSAALWLQKYLCYVLHPATDWLVEPSCANEKKNKINTSQIPVRRQDFPVLKVLLLKTYCQQTTLQGQSSSKTNLLVPLLLFIYIRGSAIAGDYSDTGSSYLPRSLWKAFKASSSETLLSHILILCLMGLSCSLENIYNYGSFLCFQNHIYFLMHVWCMRKLTFYIAPNYFSKH